MPKDYNWEADIEFAHISVKNLGNVSGDLTLKPLTLLYGPPDSDIIHLASLIHAVVVHGSSTNIFSDTMRTKDIEPEDFSSSPFIHLDLDEARKVLKRKPKGPFADSEYLKFFNHNHASLFVKGLKKGLFGPDSPLRLDTTKFSMAIRANRIRSRFAYSGGNIRAIPDNPNLHINFVAHSTARKDYRMEGHFAKSGPPLKRHPYHFCGPRPYEVHNDIHIDTYKRTLVQAMRNVLNAALYYYTERISQPDGIALVSNGGLIEFVPQIKVVDILEVVGFNPPAQEQKPPPAKDTGLANVLRTEFPVAHPGTMVLLDRPETYVENRQKFAQSLLDKVNKGLFVLLVTQDRDLAEIAAKIYRKTQVLDPQYISTYGLEPEDDGYSITEW